MRIGKVECGLAERLARVGVWKLARSRWKTVLGASMCLPFILAFLGLAHEPSLDGPLTSWKELSISYDRASQVLVVAQLSHTGYDEEVPGKGVTIHNPTLRLFLCKSLTCSLNGDRVRVALSDCFSTVTRYYRSAAVSSVRMPEYAIDLQHCGVVSYNGVSYSAAEFAMGVPRLP